jgi:DNA-binding beta-propeller fold protein YncE
VPGCGSVTASRVLLAASLSLAVFAFAAPAAAIEPLGQIGTSGSGAGQLNSPQGLATDATGSVYVADTGNNRVSQFTTRGAFVRAFGFDVRPDGGTGFESCTVVTGCQAAIAGGNAGQLNVPRSVAIGAAGNLYVADGFNNRVSQFTTQGGFVRAFGFDVRPGAGTAFEVCTAATGCQPGISGGAAGQFNSPVSAVTDEAGSLYVVEVSNNRVSQFTPQGSFVRALGFDTVPGGPTGLEVCTTETGCKAGVFGAGAGQLASPWGVTTDEADNLFVADRNNARVSQFTTHGGFVRAFGFDVRPDGGTGFEACTAATGCQAGTPGSGAGQLDFPLGIASDAAGNLFVADNDNNRLSQFAAQGGFLRAFGFGVRPEGGMGFEVCTAATGCQAGTLGSGGGQFDEPTGVAADCHGAVYVAESDGSRVQRFGDAGTPHPPCPAGGGRPPGGGPPPSGQRALNEFSFGKVKKNKRKGTAKLTVEVPGPGGLELAKTKKVKGASKQALSAGDVKLVIKPRGNAKKKVAEKGKSKVRAEVTFTPDRGDPNTKIKRVKLVSSDQARPGRASSPGPR